jgi:hypothetical protein
MEARLFVDQMNFGLAGKKVAAGPRRSGCIAPARAGVEDEVELKLGWQPDRVGIADVAAQPRKRSPSCGGLIASSIVATCLAKRPGLQPWIVRSA